MIEPVDYDPNVDHVRHNADPDEEWDRVWSSEDRNRDTLRKIEIALYVVAAAVTLVLLRGGWARVSTPSKPVVPSAADIHVRMPPPR